MHPKIEQMAIVEDKMKKDISIHVGFFTDPLTKNKSEFLSDFIPRGVQYNKDLAPFLKQN